MPHFFFLFASFSPVYALIPLLKYNRLDFLYQKDFFISIWYNGLNN